MEKCIRCGKSHQKTVKVVTETRELDRMVVETDLRTGLSVAFTEPIGGWEIVKEVTACEGCADKVPPAKIVEIKIVDEEEKEIEFF